jgi:hypothetical protein
MGRQLSRAVRQSRPRFEVNEVALSVMRIISECRNDRIAVDYVPRDGTTDSQLADCVRRALIGRMRPIAAAEEAYDRCL